MKLLIADDHQLVRQGFISLLGALDEVEIVGEASHGKQVLELLRQGKRADIVLMDAEMPVMDGVTATEQIAREFFGVKVIILTMLHSRELIQKAMAAGARGFLFKNASLPELRDALHRVAAGETFISSEAGMLLLNQSPSASQEALSQLSSREIEILRLIVEGLSSAEIGERLFISPRTVDTHRNNMIQKLQVNGIVGLVKFALEHRLV